MVSPNSYITLTYLTGFLVLYLEKKSCELNWGTVWVFRCFLSIGTPMSKLHTIYDGHFKAKVSIVCIDVMLYSCIDVSGLTCAFPQL